jgi:cytochrome c peroxidase
LQDLGRYEVTKDPKDVGAFLTPTLRNIERTAPYMHNGLFELDGVINLYNAGMPTLRRKPHQENDPLFPTKSPLLKPLDLTPEEKADLKAFLLSLTEPRQRVLVIPDRPETPD